MCLKFFILYNCVTQQIKHRVLTLSCQHSRFESYRNDTYPTRLVLIWLDPARLESDLAQHVTDMSLLQITLILAKNTHILLDITQYLPISANIGLDFGPFNVTIKVRVNFFLTRHLIVTVTGGNLGKILELHGHRAYQATLLRSVH